MIVGCDGKGDADGGAGQGGGGDRVALYGDRPGHGNTGGRVNASPRSDYGLYGSFDPGGPDPASVIGVSYFIIPPPYRRHGLAAMLLDRVIADAADRRAQ